MDFLGYVASIRVGLHRDAGAGRLHPFFFPQIRGPAAHEKALRNVLLEQLREDRAQSVHQFAYLYRLVTTSAHVIITHPLAAQPSLMVVQGRALTAAGSRSSHSRDTKRR